MKLKKYIAIRIQLVSIAKTVCWIHHTEKNRSRKNVDKDGKALYKLMNNAVYGEIIKNWRNRTDLKLVSNKKAYLKWTSKPSYTSHKIFDNDFVAIRKNKVTITLKKPAYIEMCILELSKVSMYELHYGYIKNKYGNNSRLLFTDTDGWIYETKMEDVYEDFSIDK